jgi:single-stranded-DNA-specific exonuclease
MLEETKECYERYGGHKMACGFTVKDRTFLEKMKEKVKKIADENISLKEQTPVLKIEAELNINNLDENLLNQLMLFSPFGQDNPLINFSSFDCVVEEKNIMGLDSQHVKFLINGFWAIAFSQAENWKDINKNDKIDLVYNLEYNIFNGRKNIQLKIIDIKKHE